MYLDEVDIHFNPKVGPNWTPAGRQKYVDTSGCNQKRHLAGRIQPQNGQAHVGRRGPENSLFLDLLDKIRPKRTGAARRVHLILDLDNYGIQPTASSSDC